MSMTLAQSMLLLVLGLSVGEAAAGLRGRQSRAELASLLVDMEGYLGRAGTAERVSHLESLLAPMYAALPKNERGRLEAPAVRYALHRLFSRHGMLVLGLERAGGAWNDSSAVEVLSEQVPAYVESLLEERLADHGFGLHELAILAATLKHLFNSEATQRLEAAYLAQGLRVGHGLVDEQVYEVLDTYMAIYILEGNLTNTSWVMKARSSIQELYPGWKDTQTWVHDTRRNLAFQERDATNPFVTRNLDFSDVLHIVEEINEQYGVAQDGECRELRDSLLEHEFGSTGRVRLADFHGSALKGKWQFSESKDYLRQLGALDESEPWDPRVLVPNYIYAKSNCVAKSGYYSVCCINECEGLLEQVERGIAKPAASAQEIAALVSHLPSSTVAAPRNLSQLLLRRLEAVAAAHGGAVPLHGRLFAQWMHHVYPRECPYPHLSGTTRPSSAAQWQRETGQRATASKAEMKQHAAAASWQDASYGAAEPELPWTEEEELLHPSGTGAGGVAPIRSLLSVVALVTVALSLGKTLRSAKESMVLPSSKKYYV